VRVEQWKLHEYFEDGALELYDLSQDRGERQNLAEALPEKTAELKGLLDDWRERVKAPIPTEPNPKYDQIVEAQALAEFE
jgi:hypothetical protein